MPKIRDLGFSVMPGDSDDHEDCVPTNCIGINCAELSQASCEQTQAPPKKREKDDREKGPMRAGAFTDPAIAQLKQQLRQQLSNRAY